MLRDLISSWWLLHIRGIVTVFFGLFLMYLAGTMQGIFTTSIAMVAVLIAFMFYVIVSAILTMTAAIRAYHQPHKFAALAVQALVLLVFSAAIWFFEPISINWLLWFVVATAAISGILEIALAHSFRGHLDASLLEIAGLLSVICAVVLLLVRAMPPFLLVESLAIYIVYYGGVLVLLSLRLRTLGVASAESPRIGGHSH
jgi:uncharacterized membrane protein HdeD (DUF308 family)